MAGLWPCFRWQQLLPAFSRAAGRMISFCALPCSVARERSAAGALTYLAAWRCFRCHQPVAQWSLWSAIVAASRTATDTHALAAEPHLQDKQVHSAELCHRDDRPIRCQNRLFNRCERGIDRSSAPPAFARPCRTSSICGRDRLRIIRGQRVFFHPGLWATLESSHPTKPSRNCRKRASNFSQFDNRKSKSVRGSRSKQLPH